MDCEKICGDEVKNQLLKQERHVSFEQVIYHISTGHLLARLDHSNRTKYTHQQIFVVLIDEYVYMVPFVEDDEKYFLKTIIPSRKLTKKFSKTSEGQDEIE